MKRETYSLEFITPCFCAGANQNRAEIRASSIRGQLRWWFRALGGSAADESEVFGGVANAAFASTMMIRVMSQHLLHNWTPPSVSPNDPASYVWYFASVSGKPAGAGAGAVGPRWQPHGALAPGSRFVLEISQRRPLAPGLQLQFDRALRCFLQLGGHGLRVTRGLGAFFSHDFPFSDSILSELQQAGFRTELHPGPFTFDNVVQTIGSLVKGTRKANGWKIDTMSNRPVSTSSPFGTSDPRQASAVYFRPVRRVSGADYALVVFEAPQDRVLGPISRKPSVVGCSPSRIVEPPPARPRHR